MLINHWSKPTRHSIGTLQNKERKAQFWPLLGLGTPSFKALSRQFMMDNVITNCFYERVYPQLGPEYLRYDV